MLLFTNQEFQDPYLGGHYLQQTLIVLYKMPSLFEPDRLACTSIFQNDRVKCYKNKTFVVVLTPVLFHYIKTPYLGMHTYYTMRSVLFCEMIILQIKEILCFWCFIQRINVMKLLK